MASVASLRYCIAAGYWDPSLTWFAFPLITAVGLCATLLLKQGYDMNVDGRTGSLACYSKPVLGGGVTAMSTVKPTIVKKCFYQTAQSGVPRYTQFEVTDRHNAL